MGNIDSTPIFQLTAKQLKDYLFGDDGSKAAPAAQQHQQQEKRYLYSVKQLADFLKVSYTTAWKMKDTKLRSAVYQQGRTILIDVDKVLKIMCNG